MPAPYWSVTLLVAESIRAQHKGKGSCITHQSDNLAAKYMFARTSHVCCSDGLPEACLVWFTTARRPKTCLELGTILAKP